MRFILFICFYVKAEKLYWVGGFGNFNEFASYRLAKQNHKLEEVIEQIKEGEMPLPSYTIIHSEAKLTEAEKEILTKWCQNIMDTLKANYPADSLILKKPTQTQAASK